MKTKNLKVLFALCSLTLQLSTYATVAEAKVTGGADGGGGNAVVCFDNPSIVKQIYRSKIDGGGYIEDAQISHIVSVELLDIHKARIGYFDDNGELVTPKLIESRPGETTAQYKERITKRIDGLLNGFAKYASASKLKIKSFKNGLSPIDDVTSGEIFPDNCVRSTIIAQYDEGNVTYAAVDSRIYGLSEKIFPVSSRALSLLHESLYYLARKGKDAKTSDAVQTLIGSLITEGVTVRKLLSEIENATGTQAYGGNGYEYFSVKDYVTSFAQDLVINLQQKAPFKDVEANVGQFSKKSELEIENELLEKMEFKKIIARGLTTYENERVKLQSLQYLPKKMYALLDKYFVDAISVKGQSTNVSSKCVWPATPFIKVCSVTAQWYFGNIYLESDPLGVVFPNADQL